MWEVAVPLDTCHLEPALVHENTRGFNVIVRCTGKARPNDEKGNGRDVCWLCCAADSHKFPQVSMLLTQPDACGVSFYPATASILDSI